MQTTTTCTYLPRYRSPDLFTPRHDRLPQSVHASTSIEAQHKKEGKNSSFRGSLGRPQSINAYPGHGAQRVCRPGVYIKKPRGIACIVSITGVVCYPIQVSASETLPHSSDIKPIEMEQCPIRSYKYTSIQVYCLQAVIYTKEEKVKKKPSSPPTL